MERIAAGLDDQVTVQDLRQLILEDHCCLSPKMAAVLHQSLVLAATLPDDDHDAFRTATAILLADRLQRGAGSDDLFWHWDAFSEHYETFAPSDRAAVLQGFNRANSEGLVALYDPPAGALLCSEAVEALQERLDAYAAGALPRFSPEEPDFGPALAAMIVRAIEEPAKSASLAHIWSDSADQLLLLKGPGPDLILRGFRHLYESYPDWHPHRGLTFEIGEDHPATIPVLAD